MEREHKIRLALQRFLAKSFTDACKPGLLEKMDTMTPVFEQGQLAGEFTSMIPPSVMARTAMQLYLGTLLTWSTGPENDGLGDQLLLAFQIYLQGILKP